MTFRTWHAEVTVVALAMLAVAIVSHGTPIAWLSAAAVTFSFAHGQIADRLAEREAARAVPSVHCHALAARYFVLKEALWGVTFLVSGAYPALVGVALFLAYPGWRRWWRARHPIGAS